MKPARLDRAELEELATLIPELLVEIREHRAEIRELLEELRAYGRDGYNRTSRAPLVDESRVALIETLARALGDPDALPFRAREVFDHAAVDFDLDQALKRCGIRTPNQLGAALRDLSRLERIGRWRVLRTGDDWRLAT